MNTRSIFITQFVTRWRQEILDVMNMEGTPIKMEFIGSPQLKRAASETRLPEWGINYPTLVQNDL